MGMPYTVRSCMRSVAIATVAALAACAQSTAPESLQGKAETGPDFSGSEQPADVSTPENAAKAAAAVVGVVGAAVEMFGELGDAVGDLVPSEDNPCPDGGSASGELSGSFNHPRVRMSFQRCVRGANTLDGAAEVVCDDFDGSRCHRGQVTVGNGEQLLYFRNAARVVLVRGSAYIVADEDARSLQADTSLQGEFRSLDEIPLHSFVTESLDVGIREVADQVAEVRLDGVSGFGGDSAGSRCISGRFDTETFADALRVEAGAIRSGQLRMHSPPPRPGAQQAQMTWAEGDGSAQGADGSTQSYSAAELERYCAAE